MSCEAYRCASLALFGPPAPLNHWQVIQVRKNWDKFFSNISTAVQSEKSTIESLKVYSILKSLKAE